MSRHEPDRRAGGVVPYIRPVLPRLIACDVDGTLTRRDGSIGPRTLEALRRAREAGVCVALATGRPVELFGMILDQMPGVVSHVVGGNGAWVGAVDPWQEIVSVELTLADTTELVTDLRAKVPGLRFALARTGALVWEHGLQHRLPVPPPGDPVPDALAAFDADTCRKVIAFHDDLGVHELLELMGPMVDERFSVGHLGADAVEVALAGTDKASGLAHLCRHLGITAAEAVVFGDNLNDWSMFAWAGHAVAVANADPLTRQRAHEVTASSDDDGVGLVVERLLAAAGQG